MSEFVLPKKKADEFLGALIQKQSLFAPLKKDSIVSYQEVLDPKDVLWNFSKSVVPPKGVLFPQTEIMFRFGTGKKGLEAESHEKEILIFGIRPCDGKAFLILDYIFRGDYSDPYYLERRAHTVMMGLSCSEPDRNCFCTSLGGGPLSKEGLDALFTDIGDRYYIELFSERGKRILDELGELTSPATETDAEERKALLSKTEDKFKRKVADAVELQKKMDELFDDKFWSEISLRCLGCGICAYLCPTCHCFDIQDEITNKEGRRVRVWDSCMFKEYTLHASGENPRPTRVERFKNRIYHKYKYYVDNFKVIACVGCGRCIERCPANLDLIEILGHLVQS